MQTRVYLLMLAAGAIVPAAAQSTNPVTTAVVASTATAIPGGMGNFPNFYPAKSPKDLERIKNES